MKIGRFIYPISRGKDWSDSIGEALSSLENIFKSNKDCNFFIDPIEWTDDFWLTYDDHVTVIIHPNDMTNFTTLIKGRDIPVDWINRVKDSTNRDLEKNIASWVSSNADSAILRGAFGCFSLAASGAVLLFISGGKIECGDDLKKTLVSWGLEEKKDFFFFDAGHGDQISKYFLWDDFLNADKNERLCDYWISPNELKSVIETFLSVDTLIKTFIKFNEKKGTSWFDNLDLENNFILHVKDPFSLNLNLIDFISRFTGKSKGRDRFIKNSIHPEQSLIAAEKICLPRAKDKPEGGALRLFWEWIKSKGDQTKMPDSLKGKNEINDGVHLLFNEAQDEYQYLNTIIRSNIRRLQNE